MSELPEKDREFLQANGVSKTLKRGETLFKQGTTPRHVVWLLSGKVKILQETPGGQRQTVYIYSDGDIIGYRQVIAGEVHPVTAVLLEDSKIIFIPSSIFKSLIDQSAAFARSFLAALSRDFTVWMNRTTVFTIFPVRRRVVLALLLLYEQYRQSGSPPGEITITRTELAEYVGASLETVVRVLNTLKSKYKVEVSGRRILIRDPGALIDLMEQDEV
jgi:CRP-like cAMP-binding protein